MITVLVSRHDIIFSRQTHFVSCEPKLLLDNYGNLLKLQLMPDHHYCICTVQITFCTFKILDITQLKVKYVQNQPSIRTFHNYQHST